MNYEQARQIGPDGPAPGKWNWTNANDSIAPAPYTVEPCAYPDSPIPAGWVFGQPLERTGRERCDHETREDAERHHYEHEISHVRIEPIEGDARELRRCAYPACTQWQSSRAWWPGGYRFDPLCFHQATIEVVRELNPFRPGIAITHS